MGRPRKNEQGHEAQTTKIWVETLIKLRRLRSIAMEESEDGMGQTMPAILDHLVSVELARKERKMTRKYMKKGAALQEEEERQSEPA